jgi:hypothetical protein
MFSYSLIATKSLHPDSEAYIVAYLGILPVLIAR